MKGMGTTKTINVSASILYLDFKFKWVMLRWGTALF